MPRVFRNHLHFTVIVGILTAAVTWPTVRHVFDTSVFWLPTDNTDIWMKFWDAWYFKSLIAGQADFYFTDLLFYPDGLSLVYHNFNVPHMVVFGGLQAVMPTSNAFNLTYLLIIFSTALSAYVYLCYLLKDKWISLFGAVVLGLSGYVVGRASQPDVSWIATLPLALYFFHRALEEKRWLFIGISGILAGLTAFIGMYTYVCLLLTLGLYILHFARSRWRTRHFWMRIVLLFFVIGAISIVRIYPMIADSQGLEGALNKNNGRERENDLLQYFINYEHPIVSELIETGAVQFEKPGRWDTSYLGYVPLLLIGFGIFKAVHRRKMMPWLLLILPFLILRLGSVLRINTQDFPDIFLPKHYLDEIFPAIFEGFHTLSYFQAGVLLPLAVLSCYGLMTILKSVSTQRRTGIILICIALVAFEYYRLPQEVIVTDEETAFLDWLRLEADQDSIRLINLPMNRWNSKHYLFHQTLSGYPQVEGLASRTPPKAYQYIRNNQLLKAWRANPSIQCTLSNHGEYLHALDDLADDGFSHVIHHTLRYAEYLPGSFLDVLPSYEDEFVSIYRLEYLRGSCINLIIQNYGMVARELTDIESPFTVLYDSRILLFNLLHKMDSDQVTFHFWWAHNVEHDYAFSIQIFDGRGEKVQQYDDAIAREPSAARYDVDISMLAEGSYTAKLIVYDFVTRVSQPGTVLSHQGRFERELEIAAFTIRDRQD